MKKLTTEDGKMKILKSTTLLLLVFLLLQPSLTSAQEASTTETAEPAAIATSAAPAMPAIDWSNPETIDPNQPGIDDFLDANRFEMLKKAFEAYQASDFAMSARYYLAALRYDITDQTAIYNLACCYGLMGDAEPAARNLKRAVKAGFNDLNHINRDPDFDGVRESEPFKTAMDSINHWLAKKSEAAGDLLFVKSPMMMKCRLKLPEEYDPAKKYPLVIGLHGRGGNSDNFIQIWEKLDQKVDFIYAALQAPFNLPRGDGNSYTWRFEEKDNEKIQEMNRLAIEDYVTETVQTLKDRYNVGDVYLMGFSQGAWISYLVGIKHHKLFKGIMPYGGGLIDEMIDGKSLKAARKLKVFIGHGNNAVSYTHLRAHET